MFVVFVIILWMLKARNFHSVPDNCKSVIASKIVVCSLHLIATTTSRNESGIERLFAEMQLSETRLAPEIIFQRNNEIEKLKNYNKDICI